MALRVLKIIPADKVVNSHIFIKYCCPTVAWVLFLIPVGIMCSNEGDEFR